MTFIRNQLPDKKYNYYEIEKREKIATGQLANPELSCRLELPMSIGPKTYL